MERDMPCLRSFPLPFRRARRLILSLLLCAAPGLGFVAQTITPQDQGVLVDGGGTLQFRLDYPKLCDGAGKEIRKLLETAPSGGEALLKYEGGITLQISVTPEHTLRYAFSNLPAEVKQASVLSLVSFNFTNGGTWRFDDASAAPFPPEQGEKPHLYQGQAGSFTLRQGDGIGLTLSFSSSAYNQLTDNRAWGWKVFAWRWNFFPNPNTPLTVTVRPADGPGAAKPTAPAKQVDAFGQNTRFDWPGKLKSEDELKADIAADEAYYASFKPPALDRFGGLPGSQEKFGLKKTGFFHVEQKNGKWFLADPDGNAFFHLGVCSFLPHDYTYVGGRREIYEWLPPLQGPYQSAFHNGNEVDNFSFHSANLIRKYGKPVEDADFARRMIGRVRQFGFNSGGAFSPFTPAHAELSFPYVSGLPNKGLRSIPGTAHIPDPFDEETRAKFDKLCAEALPAKAADPLLIGYYLENEPLYEDLPRVIPTLKGSQNACKRRLVEMLRTKYGTVEAFSAAWNLPAKTFDELADQALAVSTPQANADMKAYMELYFDAYFGWMSSTARQYDPNHMLIGNRLQHGTINNEVLCRAMGKYLDVISFNYYTYVLDTDFLNQIDKWAGGKPMFLSEFHWDSPKDSGLPGGAKDVGSQVERGLAYRNYVEQAAATGYIVGIEWFSLVDQPLTGRWFSKYNGENGNIGLFSVADRPWKEMIAEMAKTNHEIYPVLLGERKPFVYDNPRFQMAKGGNKIVKVPRALGPIKLDGGAENWPGTPAEGLGRRLVQGADDGGVDATFKVCWDDANLYLLVNVVDPTPMKAQKDVARFWQGDCVELFLGPTQLNEPGAPLASDRQFLLAANTDGTQPRSLAPGRDPQPAIPMTVLPNVNGQGYILEAAIPFSVLGFTPKQGDEALFDLGIDDSEDGKTRKRQFMWNGTDKNSAERKGWGRAVFNQ
ncbi:Carbohydrate family 9 binding domain-like [Verrucomicrobium sp. GAS474]|nr:Carbohydrate family 9 binding domain-like [Verrucomicrobium sp. GAS474]